MSERDAEIRALRVAGHSIAEIARIVGCHPTQVHRVLERSSPGPWSGHAFRAGRPPSLAWTGRSCWCGAPIVRRNGGAELCSVGGHAHHHRSAARLRREALA